MLIMSCWILHSKASIHPLQSAGYARAVDSKGRLIHKGDSISLRGIVQSVNIPGTLTNGYFFSVYDPGTDSSVTVYLPRLTGGKGAGAWSYSYVPTIGDSIEVGGGITMQNMRVGFTRDTTGFMELIPDQVNGKDTIYVLGTGRKVSPRIVTKLSERWESNFVELDSFTMTTPSQWVVAGGFGGNTFVSINIQSVNDTSKKEVLYVANSIITGNKAPLGTFNVRGIEYQYDITSPYTSGYMLMPRSYSDITVIAAPVIHRRNISEVNTENASGIADSSGKHFIMKGIVQSPNLYVGSATLPNGILFSIFDKTGSIMIYDSSSNFAYTPTVGDSFQVEGVIAQKTTTVAGFFGGTTFNTGWVVVKPDSIQIPSNSHGNSIKSPIITTGFADSLESKLIELQSVKLVDSTLWDTTGTTGRRGAYTPKTFFYVQVINSTNTKMWMRINRLDSFFYMKKPKGTFNVIGIEGQDTLTPTARWSIWPRTVQDIQYGPVTWNYYQIKQVSGTDINYKSVSSGTVGFLKGIAYSENLAKTGMRFSVIDASGAITVLSSSKPKGYFSPARGDSIYVYGTILQVNGLITISPDSIAKISSGNNLVNTSTITSMTFTDQSYPREFKNFKLKNIAQWDITNGAFMVTIENVNNSSDTFNMWITNATNVFFLKTPSYNFNVTGIVQQNCANSPYTTGFYIEPRDSNDIQNVALVGINNSINTISEVSIYPNPTTDILHIRINGSNEILYTNIYNSTGALVWSGKINGSTDLNTNEMKSGMYIIKLTNENGNQYTHSFIKN